MVAEIKISLAFVSTIIKSIWNFFPTVINYIFRPKAKIEIKNHNIVIKDNQNIESHISYPCILISFPKDVKIDVGSIKINNESLTCMLSRDPHFLNQKEGSQNQVTITNNRIMPFVSKNWSEICQKVFWFEVKNHEQEAFPLYFKQGMSNFLFNHKKKPKIFMARKKLIISMCIDGKTYEYALPILDVCELVINNLAFK